MALRFLNSGYFAGKVGIGTDSPSRSLQVKGTANTAIAITSSTSNLAQLALGDTDDDNYAQILLDNSTNKLQIQNGGGGVISNRGITLDSSENVGIGTSSPGAKLDVDGNILISDTDNDKYFGSNVNLILNADADANSGDSARNIIFQNRGSEKMRIIANGNVGIGVTSPTANLHVQGSSATDVPIIRSGGFGNSGSTLELAETLVSGNMTYGFSFEQTGNGTNELLIKRHNNSQSGAPVITLSRTNNNVSMSGGLSLALKATSSSTLSTDGGTTLTTKNYVDALTPGAGVFLPLAGGTMTGNIDFVNNKDISMTDNAGAVTRVMVLNTSNTMYIGPVDTYAGGSILYGTAAGVSYQRFFTGAVERMRIGSNGNVAIGTTATTYRLQVEQDNDGNLLSRFHNTADNGQGLLIRAGGVSSANRVLQLASENDTKIMTVNSNGRVGIGTANPTEKLEVAGNIKIQAALLSNQDNTDVDTGTETVANVAIATYTAAFFDFVIKKSTNVRSGTVYACHDGTNVQFTETSTQDLGNTSDVTLSVDISGGSMRLRATTTSDNWSIKSLIRAI